jgi:hypothetical protein
MSDQPPSEPPSGPRATDKTVKNGQDPRTPAEEEKPRSGKVKAFETTVGAVVSLLKIGVVVALVFWFWNERDFVKDWLATLTGGEAFGVKFQREEIDKATSELQNLLNPSSDAKKRAFQEYPINEEAARDAIIRASRVAPGCRAIKNFVGR